MVLGHDVATLVTGKKKKKTMMRRTEERYSWQVQPSRCWRDIEGLSDHYFTESGGYRRKKREKNKRK